LQSINFMKGTEGDSLATQDLVCISLHKPNQLFSNSKLMKLDFSLRTTDASFW
jgi:hypothetical protein